MPQRDEMNANHNGGDMDVADLVEVTLSKLENKTSIKDALAAIQREFEDVQRTADTLMDTSKRRVEEIAAIEKELKRTNERMQSEKKNLLANADLSANLARSEDIYNNTKKREQSGSEKLKNILSEKKSTVEQEENLKLLKAELALAKNQFNLYQNITSIVWDLTSENHICKGLVSKTNDVKVFCMNSEETSGYTITNNLWKLVEEN